MILLAIYCTGYCAALAGQPRAWNPWLCGGVQRAAWAIGHYDGCDDMRARVRLPRHEPEVVAARERAR